jgi:biotin operon repressor
MAKGRVIRRKVKEYEEEVINQETGEIEQRKVRVWDEYEKSLDKDFVKVFDAFTKDLLLDEEISGKAIRLLFYIASILEYDKEEFYLSPTEVAKELNVHRITVQKWIKVLLNKGIILKTKRRNWYKVNPFCIYRGIVHREKVKQG